MSSPYPRRKLLAEINVVPYIDVMLVLLVIFMITAPLLTQGIEVDLPQTSTEPLPSDDNTPIVLTVTADGLYYLNIGENPDTAISAEVLTLTVSKALQNRTNRPVLVKGDEKASYAIIVDAMALLQNAGAEKVGLVTRPRDSS